MTQEHTAFRSWRGPAVTLGLAAALAPRLAAADTWVKGKLEGTAALQSPVLEESANVANHRYHFREDSAASSEAAKKLSPFLPKELCVVAIADSPQNAPSVVRVAVSGGRTTPVTIVVAPNQQIEFVNIDPFPHTLYDPTGKGTQDINLLVKDKKSWTPSAATPMYEIRDRRTSSLRSFVVIEPKAKLAVATNAAGASIPAGHACATVSRRGEFSLRVPEGKYKFRAYFSGASIGELAGDTDGWFEVKGDKLELQKPLVVTAPKTPEKGKEG